MDFGATTLWWVAGGLLVAAELLSGTFYLLMLALGCAAAAMAAWSGAALPAQLLAWAVVGGGATAAWHFSRMRSPRSAPSESNRDVNIDIGQTVYVDHWDDRGVARVQYRGAAWTVQLGGSAAPAPGSHVIVAVRGNQLEVAPAAAR